MLFDDDTYFNDGQAEGERRKQEAFDTLEAHREQLILAGRRALLLSALRNGFATADDVRDAVPLPVGINPKCFGTVPSPLAKANIIRAKRQVKTRRAVGHARFVTEWEITNSVAAMEWLHSNPEAPTQREGGAI